MSESLRQLPPDEPEKPELRGTEPGIKAAPLEPEDFYYENGLIVFTAAYHFKRGYCCNSGCRHCPFR
jgi:hypothetical protein